MRKYQLKARAEKQAETRRRIVEATVGLHEEVGPALTTVAEIARRAGVQRLTVYNHFPNEQALFEACGGHWLSAHPPPELQDALAVEDPRQRLQSVLGLLYGWYRETERMMANIQRDRALSPVLDQAATELIDSVLTQAAQALGGGFRARGQRATHLRATCRLALDFFAWRRLTTEGLDDEAAAAVMSQAIAGLAERRG